MNFTTLKFGAAIAATAITSSVMVSAPAQAIVVAGDTLNFGGFINLASASNPTTTLSFSGTTILPGGLITPSTTNSTFGDNFTSFTANSLTLQKTGSNTWSLVSPATWLTGLNGNSFSLNSFTLEQNIFGIFSANFDGSFAPGGTPGNGELAGIGALGSVIFNPDGTYGASITAVPTPALVPAALGFAASMLRKRKGEEEAEKETAGAEV